MFFHLNFFFRRCSKKVHSQMTMNVVIAWQRWMQYVIIKPAIIIHTHTCTHAGARYFEMVFRISASCCGKVSFYYLIQKGLHANAGGVISLFGDDYMRTVWCLLLIIFAVRFSFFLSSSSLATTNITADYVTFDGV